MSSCRATNAKRNAAIVDDRTWSEKRRKNDVFEQVAKMTIDAEIKQIIKQLTSGPCGPLLVAERVVTIATEQRGAVHASLEPLTPSAFCRLHFGRGKTLGWFRKRARAVEALGDMAKTRLDHRVAVYIVDHVPAPQRLGVLSEVYRATILNENMPLEYGPATSLIRALLGRVENKKRVACLRCKQLENELFELRELHTRAKSDN